MISKFKKFRITTALVTGLAFAVPMAVGVGAAQADGGDRIEENQPDFGRMTLIPGDRWYVIDQDIPGRVVGAIESQMGERLCKYIERLAGGGQRLLTNLKTCTTHPHLENPRIGLIAPPQRTGNVIGDLFERNWSNNMPPRHADVPRARMMERIFSSIMGVTHRQYARGEQPRVQVASLGTPANIITATARVETPVVQQDQAALRRAAEAAERQRVQGIQARFGRAGFVDHASVGLDDIAVGTSVKVYRGTQAYLRQWVVLPGATTPVLADVAVSVGYDRETRTYPVERSAWQSGVFVLSERSGGGTKFAQHESGVFEVATVQVADVAPSRFFNEDFVDPLGAGETRVYQTQSGAEYKRGWVAVDGQPVLVDLEVGDVQGRDPVAWRVNRHDNGFEEYTVFATDVQSVAFMERAAPPVDVASLGDTPLRSTISVVAETNTPTREFNEYFLADVAQGETCVYSPDSSPYRYRRGYVEIEGETKLVDVELSGPEGLDRALAAWVVARHSYGGEAYEFLNTPPSQIAFQRTLEPAEVASLEPILSETSEEGCGVERPEATAQELLPLGQVRVYEGHRGIEYERGWTALVRNEGGVTRTQPIMVDRQKNPPAGQEPLQWRVVVQDGVERFELLEGRFNFIQVATLQVDQEPRSAVANAFNTSGLNSARDVGPSLDASEDYKAWSDDGQRYVRMRLADQSVVDVAIGWRDESTGLPMTFRLAVRNDRLLYQTSLSDAQKAEVSQRMEQVRAAAVPLRPAA